MRILHVNTHGSGGGAARLASDLADATRQAGHKVWMAVGSGSGVSGEVWKIDHTIHRHLWARTCNHLFKTLPAASRIARCVGRPWSSLRVLLGHEDFDFPGTRHLLGQLPQPPDLIHLHNLHGAYFDLRVLPWLSQSIPTFITLHDAWMMSGHCSHSFGCERWRTGCGACPDLTIYPDIRRDASAYNWRRKERIFAQSRLHVAAPCHWLFDKLQDSMLAPGVASSRIIHHGIDLSVFKPGDRFQARAELGLRREAMILLFAAKGIRGNVAKDYGTLREVLNILGARPGKKPLVFVALGEEAPAEQIGSAHLAFVPHLSERRETVRYYQAADLYVHPAKAEAWGLTITEAMACGLPVVASNVGGIPDQVADGQNGFLIPVGNAAQMAERIQRLINDCALCAQMGRRAGERARAEFDVRDMAKNYLDWYETVLSNAR